MAKSPVTAIEVRYRALASGPGDDQGAWSSRQFPPGETIVLTGLSRGVEYAMQARSLGVAGLASIWVDLPPHTVSTSPRTGPTALPPVTIGNVSSRWVSGTAVAFTATDTDATVTVTAGSLQVGATPITYGASSAALIGAADEVRTVHLYYDDPRFEGGTRTLGVTTDKVASMSSYGRIYIASLVITFDAVGGGGTGGGGGIGGGGGGSGDFPTVLE